MAFILTRKRQAVGISGAHDAPKKSTQATNPTYENFPQNQNLNNLEKNKFNKKYNNLIVTN